MMSSSPVFCAAAGVSMNEELVSSCSAAADPYRRSMLRLLEYVGLQHYGTPHATVPLRTQAENDAIAQHVEAIKVATARHAESVRQRNIRVSTRKATSALSDIIASAATAATADLADLANSETGSLQPTIYLSFEDSAEWKAFLASVDPSDRLTVAVRRRLTIELWRAHRRDICLWCWFPRNMCMCAQLDAYKAAMPASVLDEHVEVTMLLHSEELMRSTNSGHIAAYLLGAPIRVWGMDADECYLRELRPRSFRGGSTCGEEGAAPLPSAVPDPSSSVVVYNVSLYPSSDSTRVEEFILENQLGLSSTTQTEGAGHGSEVSEVEEKSESVVVAARHKSYEGSMQVTSSSDAAAEATAHADQDEARALNYTLPKKKVHLILLDSTWGQALSLNRRLSCFIPRVRLDVDESYESLFQNLRKRTRKSGVSTLEATAMAVEQCVRAMGYTAAATQATTTLTAAMKNFVDARCLLKNAAAPFTTDGAAIDAFCDRRDDARRDEAARRQDALLQKMQHDEAARQLRLPPVLNYCYCCDCVVGWHRVPEHVMGRNHRTALQRNPTCMPSKSSRQVVVPDFSRPPREERVANWKSVRQQQQKG